MTVKIGPKTFSGAKNLHNGLLASVLMSLAQSSAAAAVAAEVDPFDADNSGGASGTGVIAEIPMPTAYTTTGTDLFPKAGGETALGTIVDGVATLIEQVSLITALVGLGEATDGTGGTSGEGTIAAVTASATAVTGASGNGAGFEGTHAAFSSVANSIAQVAFATNQARVAVGLDPIIDGSGGDAGQGGLVFPEVSTDTGDATADGLSDTGVSAVDGDAFLAASADAIATLAEALDEVANVTPGAPAIVATA